MTTQEKIAHHGARFYCMNAAEEAAFDKWEDKVFRSHRELANNRNFTCWNRDTEGIDAVSYNRNFDKINWEKEEIELDERARCRNRFRYVWDNNTKQMVRVKGANVPNR